VQIQPSTPVWEQVPLQEMQGEIYSHLTFVAAGNEDIFPEILVNFVVLDHPGTSKTGHGTH